MVRNCLSSSGNMLAELRCLLSVPRFCALEHLGDTRLVQLPWAFGTQGANSCTATGSEVCAYRHNSKSKNTVYKESRARKAGGICRAGGCRRSGCSTWAHEALMLQLY